MSIVFTYPFVLTLGLVVAFTYVAMKFHPDFIASLFFGIVAFIGLVTLILMFMVH